MSRKERAVHLRLCTMCGGVLPDDATVCESCKSPQFKRQCVICGEFIPFGAAQCKECKSYQDWRKHFGVSNTVLALLIALITVTTPLLKTITDFILRHSKTAIVYQSVTGDEIRITVVNTGKSDSILRRYELVPGNDRVLTATELKVVSTEADSLAIVPAEGKLSIRLKPLTGMTALVPYADIPANLRGWEMTLRVEVEESNDRRIWRSDSFPASQIEVFILRQVPKV